jgi:hypothetical protein
LGVSHARGGLDLGADRVGIAAAILIVASVVYRMVTEGRSESAARRRVDGKTLGLGHRSAGCLRSDP